MRRPDRLIEVVNWISTSLPTKFKITIVNAKIENSYNFSAFPEVILIQSFAPFFDQLVNSYEVYPEMRDNTDVSIVNIPKSKMEGFGNIAKAVKFTDHFVIVNGGKKEGIDSYLKKISKSVDILCVVTKSHGKAFCFDPKKIKNESVDEWGESSKVRKNDVGFFSAEGTFSPKVVDIGSKELSAFFSGKLHGCVADLGAGWGWLSFEALKQKIDKIDLYEAYYTSLQCAKLNINDNRANYFWMDVMKIDKNLYYDMVIMNPPFHNGHVSDPNLGINFMKKAAQILNHGGKLFMVANRKLPYESELKKLFENIVVHQGYSGFKIITAVKPKQFIV